ncbi:MAG: hypothetical protein KAS70_05545 [Planctomycetes bacterium]|nr:hypothetical protein [Planctomycetota bacterium]
MKKRDCFDIDGCYHGKRGITTHRRHKINPVKSNSGTSRSVLSCNGPAVAFAAVQFLKDFIYVAQIRKQRVQAIKALVQAGRYETDEKVEVSAARILAALKHG